MTTTQPPNMKREIRKELSQLATHLRRIVRDNNKECARCSREMSRLERECLAAVGRLLRGSAKSVKGVQKHIAIIHKRTLVLEGRLSK